MENISKEDWKNLISSTKNAIVLDVRMAQECASGVQPNSINIDFLQSEIFLSEIEKLDKSNTYFVYCRSGNRSGQACQIMETKGFSKTYNLLGGMLEWDGEIQK